MFDFQILPEQQAVVVPTRAFFIGKKLIQGKYIANIFITGFGHKSPY